MTLRTLTAGLGLLAFCGNALAQGPAINEIYASHDSTDDQEYVELLAPPGYDLAAHFVLIVEGDSTSAFGNLDRVFELTGNIVGVDGFFVLGNTAVANLDYDIGADNIIENGTETIFLVSTDDPAGLAALAGMDGDTDDDGNLDLPGTVVVHDLVALTDGGAGDVVYDGAQAVGPDGTFLPAGIFREGDWPNPWCPNSFLDFDDVANLDQPRTPGGPNAGVCAQPIVLNEAYVSHAGVDDQEFVEVAGTAGTLLDGYLILVVEGEGASAGTLDDVFDLAGLTIPDDSGGGLGYIVAGNTLVANLDLDIGADNIIENGTETLYLVQAVDPSAVVALAGSDVDTNDDGVTELTALSGTNVSILDRLALVDGGIFSGEVAYDGAPQVGPDGTFMPAGAFRDGDVTGPWCTTAFLDFDDVANASQPRTPGETNSPAVCPPEPGVASCFGVGCPCANDDPAAGCANSTGFGGLLGGSGSTSVAADDLVLSATGLPPNNSGLYYMGDTEITPAAFFDGLQCALGSTFRFLGSIQSTLAAGEMTYTGFVADAGGLITAGSTWHFHAWHRDFPGTPCATGANLTNLYSVTFTP